jgi:asparagine N-glycosylation enzyme membrane subunit Stt3
MYVVSKNQLEELTAGYNSLYLVFFGICVGAVISLGIAFSQSSVASEKPYYMLGFVAALGLSVVSGIAAGINFARAVRCKRNLYKEAVPIQR